MILKIKKIKYIILKYFKIKNTLKIITNNMRKAPMWWLQPLILAMRGGSLI